MSIKESALNAITSITQSDFIRAVTAAGASRRVTVANLAKAIIEQYTGSSLAGSAQSVKAALDSLNSKFVMIYSGADLNTYTISGLYGINAARSSVSNCPAGYSGMIVVRLSSAGGCVQLCFNDAGLYYRANTGSPLAWTTWRRVTGTEIS